MKKTPAEKKEVFSTGDIAKLCHVAPATVAKWVDSGQLRGYRIPGSRDRRVQRDYLLEFLKEYDLPGIDVLEFEAGVAND